MNAAARAGTDTGLGAAVSHAGGAHYLTAPEVAALLRRSVKTLRAWRYLGHGPAYVAGRPTLYAAADVDAWLAARRRVPGRT